MKIEELRAYTALMEKFIAAQIGAAEFERRYLATFKAEDRMLPEEVFKILDRLFFDCDAFCADPALRDDRDLDEGQLLEACKLAYQRLQSLQIPKAPG